MEHNQFQHRVTNGLDDAMQHIMQPLIQKIDSLHDKIDALGKQLVKKQVHTHGWEFLDEDRLMVRDRQDTDLASESSQHTADSDDSGYAIVCMPGENEELQIQGNRTGHVACNYPKKPGDSLSKENLRRCYANAAARIRSPARKEMAKAYLKWIMKQAAAKKCKPRELLL